jgi:hypothetical protein
MEKYKNSHKDEYKSEDKAKRLADEFTSKTYHFDNNKKINITNLLKTYNIKSPELLVSIYRPLYNKYYNSLSIEEKKEYNYQDKSISEYQSDYNKNQKNYAPYLLKYHDYHIKKIWDIELNVQFIKDSNDQQIIDIHNFDHIHGKDSAYNILLEILDWKLRWDYNYGGYLSIYKSETIECISKICMKINPEKSGILLDTFMQNTKHTNADTLINITQLMDIFNILPEELLFQMIKSSEPYGIGVLDHKESKNITSVGMAKQLLDKCRYIDYYNGIAIKNNFRKDYTESQVIDINKFDSRNGSGTFYYHIISILNNKLYPK